MEFFRARFRLPLVPSIPVIIFVLWNSMDIDLGACSLPECGNGSGFTGENCEQNLQLQQRTHYRAAVVEYKPIPIGNESPTEAVKKNLRAYVELMNEAGHQNVDIIVFPEGGITTLELPSGRDEARKYFVEIPTIGTVPCTSSDIPGNSTGQFQILFELSCAARNNKIYTVVNLGEFERCNKEDDSNCPADGAYNYNTNIAFDRNGAVVARYRKYHLYFEPIYDYPALEHSTFSTDFGVDFGLFICFDIIFANPAVELVAKKGIRNFAFSAAWVDELPFLTAIQAQALWAQSNQANLLASGLHMPERGKMGSGIYSGSLDTALNYVFDPTSGTQLVISDVPISGTEQRAKYDAVVSGVNGHDSDVNVEHFWLREDLSNYTHKSIDSTNNQDSLCHQDKFCCEIKYELVSNEYSGDLKLVVFDGRRTVAAKRDWFAWQVCGILHCLNDTLESCTENFKSQENYNSHPKFRYLNMRAKPFTIEYGSEGISRPGMSLIDTDFRLIPQSYFKIEEWSDAQENSVHVVEVTSQTGSDGGIETVNVKTVALVQRVYSGRL